MSDTLATDTTTETDPVTPETTDTPEKGYPEGVPIADMAEGEQLAYWKQQARRHESAAKAAPKPNELRELRAAKQKLDKVVADQMSEQEKAVAAARDEGRQAALTEANESAATAIFTSTLHAKGVPADDVQDVLRPISMAAFVTDGRVDVAAIHAYADRVAGKPSNAGLPDLGQGKRGGGGALRSGEDIAKQFNL